MPTGMGDTGDVHDQSMAGASPRGAASEEFGVWGLGLRVLGGNPKEGTQECSRKIIEYKDSGR